MARRRRKLTKKQQREQQQLIGIIAAVVVVAILIATVPLWAWITAGSIVGAGIASFVGYKIYRFKRPRVKTREIKQQLHYLPTANARKEMMPQPHRQYECQGCRRHFAPGALQVDHIIPRSKGGPDAMENYQLLCGGCNMMKRNKPMSGFRSELEESDRSEARYRR